MQKNKILHVIKVVLIAGAETHLLHLIEGQRAAGLDSHLLVLVEPDNPMDDLVARAEARDIPVQRLTIRAHFDPTLPARLRGLVRRGGYGILHSHLIHADLHCALAVWGKDQPYLVTSRHNDDRFRYRWPVRLLNRWLWARVDHGIAISNWVRRFSIERENAPRDRITTVHYGIDPNKFTSNVEKDRLRERLAAELNIKSSSAMMGTVCRLVPQKGVGHALRAFWYVTKAFEAANFVVVGDGPERPQLEELVHGLEIDDRVHFLGWRDNPRQILAALDGLIVPSLWEGFGMVMLEAMALSVPVIASRVSAIPEVVIDGKTGVLVSPGDEDGLASALSLFLEDPYLAQEMGQAGRERVEQHFTVTRMVKGINTVYESLDA